MERAPAPKVEAIAVIKSKFTCWLATPKVRGIIKRKTLLIPSSPKSKIGLYLKPEVIAEGIWIAKWKKAPKITPIATPKTPSGGAKNKTPKMIPRLYKIGQRP